jgi:uroporphyrinogen decarboxylase
MNMKQWIKDQIAAPVKRGMPVLSFPSTQLLGITVRELISSSELQAKGMKAVADRTPAAAAVSMMDLSVEAETFGSTIHVSDDEVPTVVGAILEDAEDASEVEALRKPKVGDGRTGIYIEAIGEAVKLITDRPVFAGIIGPYSLAGRLLDMTNIMVACYSDPELVHAALEAATEFLIEYAKAYKAVGAHGVVMAEPAAGLLSPELVSEFSVPYVKRITEAVQDDDFIMIYHNCGPAVDKMIPELMEIGAAGYHFGNAIRMADVLPKIPADVLVMGNVDPVSAFRNGTPGSVREATLKVMDECCGYPNFVISSGCDIPPVSPWENIDAFFKTVDEFYTR